MQLLPLNLEKITLITISTVEPSQIIEAARRVLAGSSFPSKCLEVITLGGGGQVIDIRDELS